MSESKRSLKERFVPKIRQVQEPRSKKIYRFVLMFGAAIIKFIVNSENSSLLSFILLFSAFLIAIYVSEYTYKPFVQRFPWIARGDKYSSDN